MPLWERVDTGTSDNITYRLNPIALYFLACGWEIKVMVAPHLGEGGK